MSVKKQNFFLHNINKISELNSTQCRVLTEIAELSKLKKYCFASHWYISKRINMSEITVRKTSKILEELGFIYVVVDIGKPSKKFLTQKTLSIITDVHYVSKVVRPRYSSITHPDKPLSDYPDTPVSPIQESTTKKINQENQFFILPMKIASAILPDANASCNNRTSEENKSDIKEESKPIPTDPKQSIESFIPEELVQLSHRLLKMHEIDGGAIYGLSSNTERVKELLKITGVNLNGEFNRFLKVLQNSEERQILDYLANL